MNRERWQHISDVLDGAMQLPPGERRAYVDARCAGDEALRQEVLSLLQADENAHSFLEKPAREYAATLLRPHLHGPSIGQVIDGYRLLEVLGQGGMGIVYKAEDEALGRPVALKMIDPALAHDASFLRRFRAEARALARLHSPHIVTVYALRETRFGLFIAMEYVDGGTLADLLRDGAMSWQRALPIFKQVLNALDHAQSVNVIHRDIKPGNILIAHDGTVKVTDFGLAKVRQQNTDATRTKGIAGTLFYMSPEQVKGELDLDHRTDLYSAGLTMYQMLAGQLPFGPSDSEFTILKTIVEKNFPPLSDLAPEIPRPLARIIMRSLEKTPARRFSSAREMLRAIEAFEQQQDKTNERTVVSAAPLQPSRDYHKYALYTLSGLAVAAVAVLLYLLFPIFLPPSSSDLNTASSLTVRQDDPPPEPVQEDDPPPVPIDDDDDPKVEDDETDPVEPSPRNTVVEDDVTPEPIQPAEPLPGSLRIDSSPAGARILIDGQARGTTPRLLQDLPPGEYRVELVLNGHRRVTRTVRVVSEETFTLRESLTPLTATLSIRAIPWGTIYVDNQLVRSEVDYEIDLTLSATDHRITVHHPQYGTWQRDVELSPDETTRLVVNFQEKVGVVVTAFDTNDNPVVGEIVVDGTPTGHYTPRRLELTPGMHTIEVRAEGYALDGPAPRMNFERSLEEPLTIRLRKTN